MENLPLEMVQWILVRVDCSLVDLISLSLVCRQWYSAICDQLFLNRFFNRRFKRGLAIQLNEIFPMDDEKAVDDDEDDLITYGLRTSTILGVHNNNRYSQSISNWPARVLSSSFSLSCWIHLPSYTYSLIFDLQPRESERVYVFLSPSRNLWCVYSHGMQFSGQCEMKTEEWIFIVVNCPNSSMCSLWINEEEYRSESERTHFHNLSRRDDTFTIQSDNGWEIARHAFILDLHLFPFSLSSYEIKTMVKDKTSFDQMNMEEFLCEKMNKIYD